MPFSYYLFSIYYYIIIVNKLGFDIWDHPNPYPLEWVNYDVEIKVTKQFKKIFSIIVDFLSKVELDFVSPNVCGVVFGIPYIYILNLIHVEK